MALIWVLAPMCARRARARASVCVCVCVCLCVCVCFVCLSVCPCWGDVWPLFGAASVVAVWWVLLAIQSCYPYVLYAFSSLKSGTAKHGMLEAETED